MIVLSVALFGSLRAQDVFSTRVVDPNVHSLQVITDGDFRKLPVIDLDMQSSLEVSFDYLADEQPWLSYTVVHCDASWRQDDLSEMDYLDGFLPVHVTDVSPSFNTLTSYYHYSVSWPNEDIRLLLSGNYAIIFHLDNEPDSIVAIATFMVSEGLSHVSGEVSGNTDIDFQTVHQQLTLGLNWNTRSLPYLNPAEDLRLVVMQNNRPDTRRVISKPSRIDANSCYYEHNRDLIFEGGNHWRRFEYIDLRYPGLGIDHTRVHNQLYYAYVNTAKARPSSAYFYDQDQHGRYILKSLHVDDEAVEGEYFMAMFRLEAPASLNNRGVYLCGELTGYLADESSRMDYDALEGAYYKELLLKQGAYNYQFLVDTGRPADGGAMRLTGAFTEGNHFETPNEYSVFVYYRPFGARYDRLLNASIIQSR
ncbi:MAG: DUF5103 domain-containing protein [Bacteroidales bacterium]|nr:DUF5103 domain-containing protein [Candidatus Liminaster caballi]